MEIVRLPEPDEFGPEDHKVFDNTRHWFRGDLLVTRFCGLARAHLSYRWTWRPTDFGPLPRPRDREAAGGRRGRAGGVAPVLGLGAGSHQPGAPPRRARASSWRRPFEARAVPE